MATYSFLNVNASITGPGGSFNIAAGAQASEEGLTIAAISDKNVMTVGADGQVQHSLIASDAGLITARFLKTSPLNGRLMLMYEFQSSSSTLWGINIITVTDSRGDLHTCQAVAFKKKPDINYAQEGGMIEWTFDCGKVTSILATS